MKKNSWLLLAILLLCFSCTSKEGSVTGVVCDTKENLLTIVSEKGDTMLFIASGNKFLTHDRVVVSYKEPYKKGMKAQNIETVPMPGSDRDEHGCIASAGYLWSEVLKDCIRLFEKGIRLEGVDHENSLFIVFSKDSTLAELFFSSSEKSEILKRRSLPSGAYVWNIEDDDTKNLCLEDGLWTVSRRMKVIYRQEASQLDDALGAMQTLTYEGVLPGASNPGIRYTLILRSREHSGDGTFSLTMTYLEADNAKDASHTYQGRRFTLRGMPTDENATVWELVSDTGKEIFYFLDDRQNGLILLDKDRKKIDSKLNYALKRIERE